MVGRYDDDPLIPRLKSVEASVIEPCLAYLSSSDALDGNLADVAELHADQNEMDQAALSAAVDLVRQSAGGAVVRIKVSIPIIRFG